MTRLLFALLLLFPLAGAAQYPEIMPTEKTPYVAANRTRQVMKALRADLNAAFGTRYTKDDIWIGQAIVVKEGKLLYTHVYDKEALFRAIASGLAGRP